MAIEELCPRTHSIRSLPLQEELIKDILNNKDKYVIKRVIDTRGRGVWIGKCTTVIEWSNLVEKTINGPYVVQEYIQHPKDVVLSSNSTKPMSMYTNLAVFMIEGKAAGILARSSDSMVTNVGQSGCVRPVYVLNR